MLFSQMRIMSQVFLCGDSWEVFFFCFGWEKVVGAGKHLLFLQIWQKKRNETWYHLWDEIVWNVRKSFMCCWDFGFKLKKFCWKKLTEFWETINNCFEVFRGAREFSKAPHKLFPAESTAPLNNQQNQRNHWTSKLNKFQILKLRNNQSSSLITWQNFNWHQKAFSNKPKLFAVFLFSSKSSHKFSSFSNIQNDLQVMQEICEEEGKIPLCLFWRITTRTLLSFPRALQMHQVIHAAFNYTIFQVAL